MNIAISLIVVIFTMILMSLLAIKWKLPKGQVLIGIAIVTILLGLPFIRISSQAKPLPVLIVLGIVQFILELIGGLVLLFLRFRRDPERVPPETDRVILSAADGEVMYVWNIDENSTAIVRKGTRNYQLNELLGTNLASRKVYVIGVGMNFLDVHVNRCPISGLVRLIKHIDGKFISLGKDEAPFINERLTTIIENDFISIAIIQIASRLVRRIQSYLNVGDHVDAGQRLGIIRFGSLVSIIIPNREDVRIEIKPGDHVLAGTSILARYEQVDPKHP